MTPLETYLTHIREIRASGGSQDETSYYGALETLLNEYGKKLKPKVMCVVQLQNQGAGMPDGGLYTAEQFKKGAADQPMRGQIPGRGVIEVKSPKPSVESIAETEQIRDYLAKYGQVLVTNLRQFLLLGREGAPLEPTFTLADSEGDFWKLISHPRKAADELDGEFGEFLMRTMLHAAPLAAPQDVAWFLASYARDARCRVERTELPALAAIRAALEQALGMKFEGAKGEHFFRSTLVQTLFYGLFSAWVLWHKERPNRKEKFNWHEAVWHLRVPMIRSLFGQLAMPEKLGPLNLVEVMDWATGVLNRIDRPSFFESFQEAHAVQYFYEPFLEAFDPDLRKQLGVWYTPPEIVEYMVARVDTVLRQELLIEDGLADERVYVLDPCCGTGAYLVEVLRRIHQTLETKGIGALAAHELKKAAKERVFGFEILPAPFVISHLQLGLELARFGAPLSESTDERVGVYLTNALTGWEPPTGPKQHLIFPEMEEERDRAEDVKQQKPILVILGNPPYNGFAGVAVGEERELSNAYRTVKRVAPPEGQGLNELYVRFYRAAERKIVEGERAEGIVSFISNYSWLDGRSCTGMREHYLESFDTIWIDCLNGDKYKTGKLTPEGNPDPSVFSTPSNREGIQVGTAISLLLRKNHHAATGEIRFRNFWGREKRLELLKSLDSPSYTTLKPTLELGLPFMPTKSNETYLSWPLLPDLFPTSFPGVKTSRDGVVIDMDRDCLVARMQQYFDPSVTNDEISVAMPEAMQSSGRFHAEAVRAYLCKRGFLPENIVRYCYRPCDIRWLYWEPEQKLLDEKRSDYSPHVFEGNFWIEARQKQTKEIFDRGYFSHVLADNFGSGLSSFFPLYLRTDTSETGKLNYGNSDNIAPNLSDAGWQYLKYAGTNPSILFFSALAMLHSPAYRIQNKGALRLDWPRVPLPNSKDQLESSAALGKTLAALLDTDCPVAGVTSGKLRSEMPVIAVATGELKSAEQFKLTAGWGHAGKDGVTMPGKGRLRERDYTEAERSAIIAGAAALKLTPEQAFAGLGERTCDVFLNDGAWWSNIPANVWEYTIGGYQVIKKWLSYRECCLLGRALKPEEVTEVMNMARRIAAILLLQPELDTNYEAVKNNTYPWPSL